MSRAAVPGRTSRDGCTRWALLRRGFRSAIPSERRDARQKVRRMLEAVAPARPRREAGRPRYHDTYGHRALVSILASLELGTASFLGCNRRAGLGGCPYAPGATGNVATEDVLYMLDGMGIPKPASTRRALAAAAQFICGRARRPAASRAGRALAWQSSAQGGAKENAARMSLPPGPRSFSPGISVMPDGPALGSCARGCRRTLQEIAAWMEMTAAAEARHARARGRAQARARRRNPDPQPQESTRCSLCLESFFLCSIRIMPLTTHAPKAHAPSPGRLPRLPARRRHVGHRRPPGRHQALRPPQSATAVERIRAGEPLHEMWIRLTVDTDLVVHAVEAKTDFRPYSLCGDITDNFRALGGAAHRGRMDAENARAAGRGEGLHRTWSELLGPGRDHRVPNRLTRLAPNARALVAKRASRHCSIRVTPTAPMARS